MSNLNDLTAQYLVPRDAAVAPQQFDDCKVTPLIDGANYDAALEDALSIVGTGATPAENAGHFILIHNWWLALLGGRYEKNTNPGSGLAGSGKGVQIADGEPYFLDGPRRTLPTVPPTTGGGMKKLVDVLLQKARAGVDVRVMGWALTGISSNVFMEIGGARAIGQVNAMTLRSIQALRQELTIGAKAIVNDIAHPGGAGHTKFIVIGNSSRAIGFTGGIDLENGRWAEVSHPFRVDPVAGRTIGTWHDVVAKIEGPVVQALYEWFRSIWEEVRTRSPKTYRINGVDLLGHREASDSNPTPPLSPFAVPPPTPAAGSHRVQFLRTVPQFNFSFFNVLPSPDPISFAPDGLFEFKEGLKKAISGAKTYIYMEDQGYWSPEIMSWVHDAIVANNDLKVILVNGGIDPDDPVFPPGLTGNAMDIGLLRGGKANGPELSLDQKARIRFFSRLTDDLIAVTRIVAVAPSGANFRVTLDVLASDDLAADVLATTVKAQLRQSGSVFPIVSHPAIAAGDPLVFVVAGDSFDPAAFVAPTQDACDVVILRNLTMHAKVTLIDDACAVIGSANSMRRSLYTDLENSITFVDPADTLVKDFRCGLWADHFALADPTLFSDIQQSLHAWNAQWGVAGTLPRRPGYIVINFLPLGAPPLTDNQQSVYDAYTDPDSRESWGGLCPVIPAGSLGSGP